MKQIQNFPCILPKTRKWRISLSLTKDSVLLWENTGQRKLVFWHILRGGSLTIISYSIAYLFPRKTFKDTSGFKRSADFPTSDHISVKSRFNRQGAYFRAAPSPLQHLGTAISWWKFVIRAVVEEQFHVWSLLKLMIAWFLFMSLVAFYTPWKHPKTRCFLMFSGGIERKTWHETGQLQSNPQKQRPEVFCEKRCS